MTAPYRSRLLLPRELPFTDARERRWWYNYRGAALPLPLAIPGLAFWGRATDVVADGSGNVSQLTDLSGSGNHATQSTTANQPTWVENAIGGHPALLFDGAASYLECDGLAAALAGTDTPAWAIWVEKTATVASGVRARWSVGRSSSSTLGQMYAGQSTATMRVARTDDDGTALSASSSNALDTDASHIWSVLFAGTTVSAWLDGTLKIDEAALDVGDVSCDVGAIGARRASNVALYFSGLMPEIIFGAGALPSAAERQAVEKELGAYYGITVA